MHSEGANQIGDGACYHADLNGVASASHLVLIPSYNTGPRLIDTVQEARRFWSPVWVVLDGSDDGSEVPLLALSQLDPNFRLLRRTENGGKGTAILDGLRAAQSAGFSHILAMDADGQHPAALIPEFMAESAAAPEAMILGVPIFDQSAPPLRVLGHGLSNVLTKIETPGCSIGDALFGFRVYPINPLSEVMNGSRFMRRFDFDTEAVVQLAWRGVPIVNLHAPVRYTSRKAGGVSHFRYVRDNLVLAGMHARLLSELISRAWPRGANRLRSSRR